MPLSRRKFILIAGSTAVIVAAGKAAIDLDKMPSTAIVIAILLLFVKLNKFCLTLSLAAT